jgi:regulatory protein
MAMPARRPRKPRPPLTAVALDDLAIFYVGRFATSRSKLMAYLGRKIRERGWEGEQPADLEALADRMTQQGYVDDRAFALSRARSLTARGYGEGRVRQALHGAGIAEVDATDARALSETEAVESAVHFAQRRRLGPFGPGAVDPRQRERALAAMIRAGHGFALSRAILKIAPGAEIDIEELRDIR